MAKRKFQHPILADFDLHEAYLVVNLDHWGSAKNEHGGVAPKLYEGPSGRFPARPRPILRGHLWPDLKSAIAAAKAVMQDRNVDGPFGVMKLTAIVEAGKVPIKVTAVK
jgi:hypothetical protein